MYTSIDSMKSQKEIEVFLEVKIVVSSKMFLHSIQQRTDIRALDFITYPRTFTVIFEIQNFKKLPHSSINRRSRIVQKILASN